MSAPADVEFDPETADDTRDLGELHAEREVTLEQVRIIRQWQERLAATQTTQPTPLPAPTLEDPSTPAPPGAPGPDPAIVVAKDIGRGVIEAIPQAAAGAMETPGELGAAVKDAGEWVTNRLLPGAKSKKLGAIFDPNAGFPWVRMATGEELEKVPGALEKIGGLFFPEFLDPGEPQSVTGGAVRNITKFLIPFGAAGKLKAVQRIAGLGKFGEAAAVAGRGALADFAAFDPDQGRLSDLLVQVPSLQNPVTEFLASKPDDTQAGARFKSALEGLGLGAVAEGMVRGLRVVRAARGVKEAAGVAEGTSRAALSAADADSRELARLAGDPAGSAIEIRDKGLSIGVEGQAPAAVSNQPGEVFINMARINSEQDVKDTIQALADAKAGRIEDAKRGVRTWAQTKLSAAQENAWEIITSRRKGQPLNAEQTDAVREFWVKSAAEMKRLAQEVGTGSDLAKIAFRKQLAIHNIVQDQVLGARAEAARSLNAWKIQVGDGPSMARQFEDLRSVLQSSNEGARTEDLAQKLLQLDAAGMEAAADKFLYGSRWARTKDAVTQLYYASRLSSPYTHMRNFLGNTTAIFQDLMERKAANLYGQAVGDPQVLKGETLARTFGYYEGMKRALRATAKGREAYRAAKKMVATDPDAARAMLADASDELGTFWQAKATGGSGFGLGKYEEARRGAFDPERLGLDRDSTVGRAFAWFDTATNAPARALTLSDEIFKTMAYDAEILTQAWRKAQGELERGEITQDMLSDRLATLIDDPEDYVKLAAQRNADVQTFSQQPENTRAWRAWKGVAEAGPLGKLAIPFKKTPFNIATYTFQRTPLAPFVKTWQDDIKAGGARGQLAWTKFVTGNAMLMTFANMALGGTITGAGPGDARQRATLARTGWKPNSIRFETGTDADGKPTYRYVSYLGLEPISTSLALAANTADTLRFNHWNEEDPQWDEIGIAASLAVASQISTQSYMSGAADLIQALADPAYGETYAEKLAQIPVPLALASVAKIVDPTMRMATNVVDAARAKTPGLSKDLPARRDLWGEPMTYSSGLGSVYDFIMPLASKASVRSPIDEELLRLEKWVSMPAKQIEGVSLRNEGTWYERYVELAGNAWKNPSTGKGLKETLDDLVSGKDARSARYAQLSDGPEGGKARVIQQVVDSYREAAAAQLRKEFPELEARIRAHQERQRQQLTGPRP